MPLNHNSYYPLYGGLIKYRLSGAEHLSSNKTQILVSDSNHPGSRSLLKQIVTHHLGGVESHWLIIDRYQPHKTEKILLEQLNKLQPTSDGFQITPITIFFGHRPSKERNWLQTLFAEQWRKSAFLWKIFRVLFNGREVLMRVDTPLVFNCKTELPNPQALIQQLNYHFFERRRAILGPPLSHRNQLIRRALNSVEVPSEETAAANHMLRKIAADMNPITIRLFHRGLRQLWRCLYSGIEVHNDETIKKISLTHQLIYLPCHRSHIDYLLLSWTLYHCGLALPHIIAGDNLDLPILGNALRRAGAIFMRRQFADDPIYTQLFNSYIEQVLNKGYSLEFFIEGGRSRTGRLLPPRTGLLKTLLMQAQKNPKPLAIVPVWIGYDRLIESQHYQTELERGSKKPETLLGLSKSIALLRKRYGKAYISFAQPILLDDKAEMNRHQLALHIIHEINSAALITPNAVLGTVLLGTPNQRLKRDEFLLQLEQLYQLLLKIPLTQQTKERSPNGNEWIQQAIDHQMISQSGDLLYLNGGQAQQLTFYRNTILHALTLPSLYLLLSRRMASTSERIHRVLHELYPYLQAELSIPYPQADLEKHLTEIGEQLKAAGLLTRCNGGWQTLPQPLLLTLKRTVEPLLVRYYLIIRLLTLNPMIDRASVLYQAVLASKRIHLHYGFQAPEYADGRVIELFIDQLAHNQLISIDENTRISLLFDTSSVSRHANHLLSEQLIQQIEQLASPNFQT